MFSLRKSDCDTVVGILASAMRREILLMWFEFEKLGLMRLLERGGVIRERP